MLGTDEMREPSELVADIERIIGDEAPGDGHISVQFTWDGPDEARALSQRLVLMQKELRIVKKESQESIREIKALGVENRSKVQPGFVSSLFLGSRGSARYRAQQRQDSKKGETQLTTGYRRVNEIIDQILFQIDTAKHQTDATIRETKAEAPTVPVKRASAKTVDPIEQIRGLKQLLDEGLISQDEYDSKRKDILARI